jgi:hypothetical protein
MPEKWRPPKLHGRCICQLYCTGMPSALWFASRYLANQDENADAALLQCLELPFIDVLDTKMYTKARPVSTARKGLGRKHASC